MTAFRIISIAASLGLALLLSYRRFKATHSPKTTPFFSRVKSYFFWLGHEISKFLKRDAWRKAWSFYRDWLSFYPRPWQKWALSGVIISFLYLAPSGLGFALFSPRGLFGLALLVHVGLGGIFAVCLAALTVIRAKEYVGFAPPESSAEPPSSFIKNIPQPLLRSLLFWLFILSGLSLGLTAFLSMLPYLTFEAQVDLVWIHRYSGLLALLSAMLLLDQAVPPQEK